MSVFISGTGLFTPKESISNDELVQSFNSYVAIFNKENKDDIEAGIIDALTPVSYTHLTLPTILRV